MADDPRAAELGHQLFFDPGFSGQLLDSDNSGDSHSLGNAGESGKVACAGCHVPSAGFVDNRSVRAQVSLAAGWGKRRTKPLLDVGQAKVIMWDGRHDALYNQPFQPLEGVTEMNSSRLYAAEQVYKRYRASYETIFGPIPVPLDDASRFPQLDGATTGCRSLSPMNEGVDCHGMPGDGAEFDHLTERSGQGRDHPHLGEHRQIAGRLRTPAQLWAQSVRPVDARRDRCAHAVRAARRGALRRSARGREHHRRLQCVPQRSVLDRSNVPQRRLQPAGVGPAGSFYDANDHGAKDGLAAVMTDPLNVRGKFSDGDDGRLTEMPTDLDGAFRTPSLRCVGGRPSFMHTGQMLALADVVSFFSRGGNGAGYPGSERKRRAQLHRRRAVGSGGVLAGARWPWAGCGFCWRLPRFRDSSEEMPNAPLPRPPRVLAPARRSGACFTPVLLRYLSACL